MKNDLHNFAKNNNISIGYKLKSVIPTNRCFLLSPNREHRQPTTNNDNSNRDPHSVEEECVQKGNTIDIFLFAKAF